MYIRFGPSQHGVPVLQLNLGLPDALHHLGVVDVGLIFSFLSDHLGGRAGSRARDVTIGRCESS
jgi:hypothetical protein